MTLTGTTRGQRRYTYYSCARCQQKAKSVCRGRHVPMLELAALVLQNVKKRLLVPNRLVTILDGILARRSQQEQSVIDRRKTIEAEIIQKKEQLARLYRAIEKGVFDLDADLKDRIQTLKT